ncbi:hypothetical protein PENTCL1PPCAC_22831, partial [Pristionchus entomophagus]
EQGLAQLKKVDSLKLCVIGLSMLLKTMEISILPLVALLALDDVTLKSHFHVLLGSRDLEKLDSLKLWGVGFSRVLMTIGLCIFVMEPPLAPDGVTSKSNFFPFLVTPSGANGGSMRKMNRPIVISTLENPKPHSFKTSSTTKRDFDVTPSGADEGSVNKMDMPIVFSTLENPDAHSFRKLSFFRCSK